MKQVVLSNEIVLEQWYRDNNAVRMFLHLLLMSDNQGRLDTSRTRLAVETGTTAQRVRTSLKRLVENGMITMSTGANTRIQITDRVRYANRQVTSAVLPQEDHDEDLVDDDLLDDLDVLPRNPAKFTDNQEDDEDYTGNSSRFSSGGRNLVSRRDKHEQAVHSAVIPPELGRTPGFVHAFLGYANHCANAKRWMDQAAVEGLVLRCQKMGAAAATAWLEGHTPTAPEQDEDLG